MIDLDAIEVLLICPNCEFYNPVTIKQARLGDVLICRGCKANLQCVDALGQLANARSAIQKRFAELAELFHKPIRLTLKL